MATVHHLTRRDARRAAVRAQLLARDRPTDLLAMVRHLTLLQWSPTRAVTHSHDLVAWSRLGSSYAPEDLDAALDVGRLVVLDGMFRPAEDIALYRAEMASWPSTGPRKDWHGRLEDWVAANDRTRSEVLDRLRLAGPLPKEDLPDTCAQPWRSSGWSDGRNLTRLLDMMVGRGEIALVGLPGRGKEYDLAERVYPDDPVVPLVEAEAERDRRRLLALGIARLNGPECPVEPDVVGMAGEAATVEGVRGEWRVEPSLLDQLADDEFPGRTALLSPLDRLVSDRKRLDELFAFDYQLEMYKPAANRKWGYWALPILHGDRFVGKLDATADRDRGALVIHAIHDDVDFTPDLATAVDAEVDDLAAWLDLERVDE